MLPSSPWMADQVVAGVWGQGRQTKEVKVNNRCSSVHFLRITVKVTAESMKGIRVVLILVLLTWNERCLADGNNLIQ